MCHNSTCAWDYATQHEYCTHCHNYGFCEGFQGRCHCNANHQHILPINYQQQATSRYGKDAGTQVERPDWYLKNYHTTTLSQTTTSPVPFYVEDIAFHMDERRRKDCLFVKCPHQFCSGHGYCTPNGTCHCDPSFIGGGCQYQGFCPTYCTFQGICEPKLLNETRPWDPSYNGDCKCYDVFSNELGGTACSTAERNFARQNEMSNF